MPDGFKVSWKYVTALRPFQVKNPRHELCMCVHHLKFKNFATGLYKYRKTLRDKKIVQCNCTNILDPYELRRKLTCPRADKDSAFDAPKCVTGKCSKCLSEKSDGLLLNLMCKEETLPDTYAYAKVTWDS